MKKKHCMVWGFDMPAVDPAAAVAPASPVPPGATNEKKNGREDDGSEKHVDKIETKKWARKIPPWTKQTKHGPEIQYNR